MLGIHHERPAVPGLIHHALHHQGRPAPVDPADLVAHPDPGIAVGEAHLAIPHGLLAAVVAGVLGGRRILDRAAEDLARWRVDRDPPARGILVPADPARDGSSVRGAPVAGPPHAGVSRGTIRMVRYSP